MPATRQNLRSQSRAQRTASTSTHPTLKALRAGGTEKTRLVLVNQQKEREEFTSGDCVYIAHESLDLSLRPLQGDDYWKGKIRSIFKYKGEDWVVVSWFYTIDDLISAGANRNEMERLKLGTAELILSNHEDVVSASCIEDKCNVKRFDDRDPCAEYIKEDDWFFRLEAKFGRSRLGSRSKSPAIKIEGINVCPCCDVMYDPNVDQQRFCTSCREWMHEACCLPGEDGATTGEVEDEISRLIKVPLSRGYGGCETSGSYWQMAGSGRRLLLFREWNKKGAVPESWKQNLGPQFVDQLLSKNWVPYVCPTCKGKL